MRWTEGEFCLFLTCSARRIGWGGREDLRSKVFKGHDLSVVLNNGLQVERSLLVAGGNLLKEQTVCVEKKKQKQLVYASI